MNETINCDSRFCLIVFFILLLSCVDIAVDGEEVLRDVAIVEDNGSVNLFSLRLEDCTTCFQGNEQTTCHKLIFTCPLYHRFGNSAKYSRNMFKSEVSHYYRRLRDSGVPQINQRDLFCLGFAHQLLERSDCELDTGERSEFPVAGIVHQILQRLQVEYKEKQVSCEGWKIDHTIHNYSVAKITFDAFRYGEATEHMHKTLIAIRDRSFWTSHFSAKDEDIRVTAIEGKVEVQIKLAEKTPES